jgi:hypothetical protein
MARKRARRYRSRREAEREHPLLHQDNLVPLENFADLLGDYEFPKLEYVRCQLIDAGGKCHKLHGWGWIAQLKNESEGYIGHDCAEEHFGGDPRFAAVFTAAAERVDKEITIGLLEAALRPLIDDPSMPDRLNDVKRRWRQLYDRAANLPGQLTEPLRKELSARRKQASLDVVINVIQVETEIDENKRERKIVTRHPTRWGVLSGLQALDIRPLGKIGLRLDDAGAAIRQAVISGDQSKDTLSKWLADLQYIERADQALKQHEANLLAFCRPDNLKLLWLLFSGRFEQLSAIRVALEIISRKRVMDDEVATTREAWAQEIKAANGGSEFNTAH